MKWAIAFLLLFAATIADVQAHHNIPPVLRNTMGGVFATINDRGYGKWAMGCDGNVYPNFRAQLFTVLDDEQQEIGISWVEVSLSEAPDVIHCLTYEYPCVPGSAGCVLGLWGPPALVYYQEALLYGDWQTTQGHEIGHASDNQHEEYNDKDFKCLAIWQLAAHIQAQGGTRMSCGTGIWWVTQYDKNVVWAFYVPDRPAFSKLITQGNWATVLWGTDRADNGFFHHNNKRNDSATRISFAWSPDMEAFTEPMWVGDLGCGEEYGYCFTPYSAGSREFDEYWRGCLWMRAENKALWWAPQPTLGDSASGWWTSLGCW
mgnify:CR=1 FL=1